VDFLRWREWRRHLVVKLGGRLDGKGFRRQPRRAPLRRGAPPGATAVRIEYEGEHTVPVVHGHFLFVAWDTEFATDPRVVEFITD